MFYKVIKLFFCQLLINYALIITAAEKVPSRSSCGDAKPVVPNSWDREAAEVAGAGSESTPALPEAGFLFGEDERKELSETYGPLSD